MDVWAALGRMRVSAWDAMSGDVNRGTTSDGMRSPWIPPTREAMAALAMWEPAGVQYLHVLMESVPGEHSSMWRAQSTAP